MNFKNELKVGAILSYFSMALTYIISLIYTPIMLGILGQSEYGLFSFVVSIVAYLGVIHLGFGSTYMRYYLKYKSLNSTEEISVINAMFIIIFSILGMLALVAGVFIVFNAELVVGQHLTIQEVEKAKALILILVLNLGMSMPGMVFSAHITANEKFIYLSIMQLVRIIANPMLTLPLLLMGYGSIGMVVISSLINISIEMHNIYYCIKKLKMKFKFKEFDYHLMKEIGLFSFFIFINMLIDQVNWNVDKLLLGWIKGTVSVAVYGLSTQINMYYISASTAISNVFAPRIHRMVSMNSDNIEVSNLFAKIGRLQFIVLAYILSLIIVFGDTFIVLWVGENYKESYAILLLIAIPVTIPLIQNIGIEIQRAKNLHKFRSYAYLIIALMNVALSIPLIRIYGGIGAAIGTGLSLIIGNGVLMNIYYQKKIGLNIQRFWREILKLCPAVILPLLLAYLLKDLLNPYNWLSLTGTSALYSLLYLGFMWLLGLNHYEKDLLGRPFISIIKKLR